MRIDRQDDLTPEIKTRVVDLLRAGVSIRGAMRAIGKSRATYFNWQNRGKEGRSELHVQFLRETREARGDIEKEMVDKRVSKAKKGDNESIDKVLKQVNRQDYSDRMVVEAEIDKALERLEKALTPEEFARAMDALEEE